MSLNTIAGRKTEILHPATRTLFNVWDAIRQGRSAPVRNELDLRAIRKQLANIALIERHPLKPSFSFRLAGTALRTIFGKELTGSDFLKLWSQVEQDTIRELASSVISKHQPAVVRFKGFTRDGRAEGIEMILLPLVRADRQETQIIAAIAPFTEPYWLGIHAIVRSELISQRIIWVESEIPAEERPQDVFAENGRPLTAPVKVRRPAPVTALENLAKKMPSTPSVTGNQIDPATIQTRLHLIRGGVE